MNQLYPFAGKNFTLLIIVAIWSLFWKIPSIWMAIKNDKKWWFVVLLIFNTLGILEIVYIFFVAKKNWNDIKEIYAGLFSPNKQ